MKISEGVVFLPMPKRPKTMSNDAAKAAITFMFGGGERPSSQMLGTVGSLSLPFIYSGLIRFNKTSFSFRSWAVYYRIDSLHINTKGLGAPSSHSLSELFDRSIRIPVRRKGVDSAARNL